MKIAVEILKKQKAFFKYGPGHLKPLVLRDVAEAVSMHESTVSRVTRSKLLQTPWGIFQMKDFFSSSLGDTNQEAHAAKTVRNTLKEIIKNELFKYEWLHLHHEDFTGQYGKFYRNYRNAAWYIKQQKDAEARANAMGFDKVSKLKLEVGKSIKEFVAGGGFLFTMCSGTDSFDISFLADNGSLNRSDREESSSS